MNSIIRRFDRAPLEDRLLRANPAQPPKTGKGAPKGASPADRNRRSAAAAAGSSAAGNAQRKSANGRRTNGAPARQSAFA